LGLGEAFAGIEKWDAAAKAYLGTMGIYEELGAEWGIAGSRTGLGHVALAQGDVKGALGFVEALLDYLEGDKGLGYGAGQTKSYLICIQVLQAAGDPRAREVLEKGHAELQERAEKITDEALLRSFMENVPFNRELVKLWEEQRSN
jgi:hypothetical protein